MQTAERRQQLREDLIRAGERRIAEQGLAGLKTRDLAQEVGCALGAIYNVFPDLDALVFEVNVRTLAAFEAAIAGAEPCREGGEAPDPRSAVAALVALATAYLDFAAANRQRWRALFQHRLPEDKPLPDWYRNEQARLFVHVEAPLGRIRPDLGEGERAALARSLFSAVHGMVSLGLDEKLAPMPFALLREQVILVTAAMGRGLIRE